MMKKILFVLAVCFMASEKNTAQTVTDIDGHTYATTNIGNQIWMKENLKTTRYNDGSGIPEIMDGLTWRNQNTGARCYYQNDSAAFGLIYGALYNWHTVSSNKLCPVGWHVPNETEWRELEFYLGGDSIAGGKMKESGYEHWEAPNTGATNSSGFSALPGGLRINTGAFQYLGENGLWWTSSAVDDELAAALYCWNQFAEVKHNAVPKTFGFSVRCVKNNGQTGMLENDRNKPSVVVYPNPTTHWISVQTNTETQIKIYNPSGVLLLEQTTQTQNTSIDLSKWPCGVYVMMVITAEGIVYKRVLKQ